jgi:hypothetical protein
MTEKRLVQGLGQPDTQEAVHRHRKNVDAYSTRRLLIERCCPCIHPFSNPYQIGFQSSTCVSFVIHLWTMTAIEDFDKLWYPQRRLARP